MIIGDPNDVNASDPVFLVGLKLSPLCTCAKSTLRISAFVVLVFFFQQAENIHIVKLNKQTPEGITMKYKVYNY